MHKKTNESSTRVKMINKVFVNAKNKSFSLEMSIFCLSLFKWHILAILKNYFLGSKCAKTAPNRIFSIFWRTSRGGKSESARRSTRGRYCQKIGSHVVRNWRREKERIPRTGRRGKSRIPKSNGEIQR